MPLIRITARRELKYYGQYGDTMGYVDWKSMLSKISLSSLSD